MGSILLSILFALGTIFVGWHIWRGVATGVMQPVIWGRLTAKRSSNPTGFYTLGLYNLVLFIVGVWLTLNSDIFS